MKFSAASLPRWRLITLILFAFGSLLMFLYLYVHSGGSLPGYGPTYRLTAQLPDAQNLVSDSDVDLAGVKVGSVKTLSTNGKVATAVLAIDKDALPLHQGATIALRSKTLVEETYVQLTDGHGPALKSGSALPVTANTSDVHLDQVLDSLDPKTRTDLGQAINSGNAATAGRASDLSAILSASGVLGKQGNAALAALADQNKDITTLSRNTTSVLADLDTSNGQLSTLINDANTDMGVSATQQKALSDSIRALPGTLAAAKNASGSLVTLASDLRPIAANLKAASPDLSTALTTLPNTTSTLRAELPDINKLLGEAPATLTEVPAFSTAAEGLPAPAGQVLADLDPMLGYVQPYGHDVAAFFSNVGGALQQQDSISHYARILVTLGAYSATGDPLATNAIVPGAGNNPYPAPLGGTKPVPTYTGTYPKVTRDTPAP